MTNNESKGRLERAELIKALEEKYSKAKSVVFANYNGLTAKKASDLRAKLGESDAEAVIAKNTLFLRAADIEGLELTGQTLAVFSYADAISGIKSLFDFSQENEEKPEVTVGVVDGILTSNKDLVTLSKLPSRQELLARTVGGMKSPIFGLVNTLSGVQTNLVRVLSEISKVK